MPQGLRIVAGDAGASSHQDHTYWACDNEDGVHHETIRQCPDGAQLEMTIDFPQCWDGTNLDSATWIAHCLNAQKDCHSHLLGDGREMEGDA